MATYDMDGKERFVALWRYLCLFATRSIYPELVALLSFAKRDEYVFHLSVYRAALTITDPLVLRIICSTQLRSQLHRISTTHDVVLRMRQNTITLSLESSWGDLAAAEKDVLALARSVTQAITLEPLILHNCHIPLLASDPVISEINKIDEQFGVDISVVATSGDLVSFSDFVTAVGSLTASDPGSLLLLSHVSRFSEMHLDRNWRYQDALKQMRNFPPAINSLLNVNFFPFRRGIVGFTFDSIQYSVDFSRMIVAQDGCQEYGTIDNESPLWSYSEAASGPGSESASKYTRPFDLVTSQEIDLAVQYGVPGLLTLGESQVSFDVLSTPVVLHDVTKSCKWELHRNPALPHDSRDCLLTLAIRCRSEDRPDIVLALNTLLQKQTATQIYTIPPATTVPLQCLLVHMARQYCVKLCFVESSETSKSIRLEGEKDYVCGVKMYLLEVFQQSIVPLCMERPLAIPKTWKQQQRSAVETVPVPVGGGEEWSTLENLLRKSLRSVKLVEITRVQNLTLWRRYSFFKSLMSRKNGSSQLNEKYLFHGTRTTDPMTIISSDKGFDFRYGSDDCLWGKGTYFAVDASYCDSRFVFQTSQGTKQVFVARVLTGRSVHIPKPNRALKEPPRLPNSTTDSYDSVNGVVENPTHTKVYVIYDHDKAYPAYLLTYRN